MGDAPYLPQSALPEVPGLGARNGSPNDRPNSFPYRISTSSLPCRPTPERSPFRTRPSSMPSCSAARPRHRHHRGQPQASRRSARCDRRSPYLGPDAATPSAYPLRRAWWWTFARRHTLGRLPARLLPAGARPLPAVPQSVSARAPSCLRGWPVGLLWRSRPSRRIRRAPRSTSADRLPSRWGRCRRHPQTRTCRFPASGSSRERFARGGVAVEDLGRGQRVPRQKVVEAGPSDHALTISPRQPLAPDPHHFVGEPAQASTTRATACRWWSTASPASGGRRRSSSPCSAPRASPTRRRRGRRGSPTGSAPMLAPSRRSAASRRSWCLTTPKSPCRNAAPYRCSCD
ncbi:hypothetical protein ACVIHH_008299 [Bradyrhizobium sp. USDA 4518]